MSRVSDILLQRGQNAAQAAEAQGQIWGGLAQGLGQLPGQIIGQQIGLQKDVQEQQLRQSQIAAANAQTAERQQQTLARERDLKAQELWAQAIKGSTGDDGLPDYTKAASLVDAAGFPLQAASFLENADQAATRRLTRMKLTRELHEATQNDLGEYALETLNALNTATDPLHARDIFTGKLARAASDGLVSEQEAGQLMMQTAQASPDQLKQFLTQLVPAPLQAREATRLKGEAETAKLAAETKNLQEYGRTTPGTLEEQYLHKLTTGDTAGAKAILASMRATAEAKRDPDAAALSNTLRNLNIDQARQRLDALREKNKPLDIEADVQTTVAGRKYIDLSLYSAGERDKARSAANTAGAIPVSKEQANALQEIDNARANQKSINDQIQDLLPRGVGGRILSVPTVKLEKLFQTDERVAAFNSWRTAAIQTLRATAGSKGLRINQAEIAQAIENDIPKLTDTLGTAQQKLKNIDTMLENAEKSILIRDRTVTPAAAPTSKAPALSPGLDALSKR